MKKISRRSFLKGSALAAGAAALTACGGSDTASSAEEGGVVTLSFFDKNSGSKTFDDPVAQQINGRHRGPAVGGKSHRRPDEKTEPDAFGPELPRHHPDGSGRHRQPPTSQAGALVELDDLLEENCPNLLEMYGRHLEKCPPHRRPYLLGGPTGTARTPDPLQLGTDAPGLPG